MTTLRAAAQDAYEAAQQEETERGRTALGTILAGLDVSTLTPLDTQVTPGWTLVVFASEDVRLAARHQPDTDWQALLVRRDDKAWTELAEVTSLAHLGEVLPDLFPPVLPWVKPAAGKPGYPEGARVTYNGGTWVSLRPGNTFSPAAGGWLEVI